MEIYTLNSFKIHVFMFEALKLNAVFFDSLLNFTVLLMIKQKIIQVFFAINLVLVTCDAISEFN